MSNCQFKFTGERRGEKFVHRCSACHAEFLSRKQDSKLKATCKNGGTEPLGLVPPPPPASGPGTELAKLFAEYGIKKRGGCGCENWVARMNAWGPKGCEEHREEILAHLKQAYDMTSFWEKTKAAAVAWLSGLPMSIEGVTDEAIRRAIAEARRAVRDADEYLGGEK